MKLNLIINNFGLRFFLIEIAIFQTLNKIYAMMNHKVIAANNARVWPRVCVNPHRLFSGPYLCPDMPPPLIPRFNKKNLGKRTWVWILAVNVLSRNKAISFSMSIQFKNASTMQMPMQLWFRTLEKSKGTLTCEYRLSRISLSALRSV